jgi:hypothetical protein
MKDNDKALMEHFIKDKGLYEEYQQNITRLEVIELAEAITKSSEKIFVEMLIEELQKTIKIT